MKLGKCLNTFLRLNGQGGSLITYLIRREVPVFIDANRFRHFLTFFCQMEGNGIFPEKV